VSADEALSFLEAHQPMPDTRQSSDSEWSKYDEIREFFEENPDERCIPLFLNSFGQGDGRGVYQLIEDVIRNFSSEVVVPHLKAALTNSSDSIKYWNSQIASWFPDVRLVSELAVLITHSDSDLRCAALIALSGIQGQEVTECLQVALDRETDGELRELMTDALLGRETS
jgi:hypothetical protein